MDGVMYIRRKMLDSVESHAYSTLVEVNCCNVIWEGIVTGNFKLLLIIEVAMIVLYFPFLWPGDHFEM